MSVLHGSLCLGGWLLLKKRVCSSGSLSLCADVCISPSASAGLISPQLVRPNGQEPGQVAWLLAQVQPPLLPPHLVS